MLKLHRHTPFYMQPWFWTLAIICGQYYGIWWASLGEPEPVYVPQRLVIAQVDPFNVTITAPGIRHASILRAAHN